MTSNKKYLLICNTSDGLIAQVNGVVIQLQFARRMGLEPIVYLHERSFMFGGPNPYFDAEAGPNVWDCYFEPIGVSGDALNELIESGTVYTLANGSELMRLYRWDPSSWYMNPFGYFRSIENRADGTYPAEWWEEQRDHARQFLDDGTLRFSPAITAQVEAFSAAKFGKNTLGLQLRGSDKYDFGVGPNLSRKITPEEYYPYIDKYLADHPNCDKIFVATDQRQWLRTMEEAYPDHVISYSEMSLSDSDDNMFNATSNKAARGSEVLIDMLLLARCDYLIKCHAAVGEMAIVMNPDLKFIDLNYETQTHVARSKPLASIARLSIRTIGYLWKKMSEAGLALDRVQSINGSEVLVGKNNPRSLNTKSAAYENAPRPPIISRAFLSGGLTVLLEKAGQQCVKYKEESQ